jgi:hypothetical protein
VSDAPPANEATQAAQLVGRVVRARLARQKPGIWWGGLVVNFRFRFGHWDVLVVPLVGEGSHWMTLDCVELTDAYDRVLSPSGVETLQQRVDECGLEAEPS